MFNPTNLSFLMIAVFFSSCQKNPIPSSEVLENKTISTRNMEDDQWLIDFQGYLRDLRDGNPTESSYTLEEAVFGIEALVNYYGEGGPGISEFISKKTFIINENSNWLDFFQNAEANVIADIQEETDSIHYISSINIEIDSIVAGSVYISTGAEFYNKEESVLQQYTMAGDCTEDSAGPFAAGDSYFMGVFGDHPDSPNGDAQGCIDEGFSCGGVSSDGIVTTTALDEVENFLNATLPNTHCPEDFKVIYTDIQEYTRIELWDTEFFSNCLYSNISLKVCSCVDSGTLNCILCTLSDLIDNPPTFSPFFELPPGYELISVNAGAAYIFGGGTFGQNKTALAVTYYIGKPKCVPIYIINTPIATVSTSILDKDI